MLPVFSVSFLIIQFKKSTHKDSIQVKSGLPKLYRHLYAKLSIASRPLPAYHQLLHVYQLLHLERIRSVELRCRHHIRMRLQELAPAEMRRSWHRGAGMTTLMLDSLCNKSSNRNWIAGHMYKGRTGWNKDPWISCFCDLKKLDIRTRRRRGCQGGHRRWWWLRIALR